MTNNSVNTYNSATGFTGAPAAADTVNALAGVFGNLPATVVHTFAAWQKRSEDRAHLQEMPSHLLKDMGITHEDVKQEVSKPFWRV